MATYFPSIEELRAFVAIVEAGRFKYAAEDLRVTESAVSHQLRRLEDGLGTRLVNRGRDRASPTEAGARFYAGVADALKLIVEASDEIGHASVGKVKITLPRSLATHWLMRNYPTLTRSHPDLQLELVTTSRLCDLAGERIDLGIRYGTGNWSGLSSRHLFDETIFPVATPDLARKWRSQGWTGEPDGRRIIVNNMHRDEWRMWSHHRQLPEPSASRLTILKGFELVLNAGLAGLGLIMARRPMIDQFLANGDLIAPFGTEGPTGNSYYVVWPEKRALPRRAALVGEWLLLTGRSGKSAMEAPLL